MSAIQSEAARAAHARLTADERRKRTAAARAAAVESRRVGAVVMEAIKASGFALVPAAVDQTDEASS